MASSSEMENVSSPDFAEVSKIPSDMVENASLLTSVKQINTRKSSNIVILLVSQIPVSV
jgi:hypothetical protein